MGIIGSGAKIIWVKKFPIGIRSSFVINAVTIG
jgi:hypothetical protein